MNRESRAAAFALASFALLHSFAPPAVGQTAEGDRVHFLLISLWQSREAIQAYAGPDIERARYYDYDRECLVDPEPNVTHYEVVLAPETDEARPPHPSPPLIDFAQLSDSRQVLPAVAARRRDA